MGNFIRKSPQIATAPINTNRDSLPALFHLPLRPMMFKGSAADTVRFSGAKLLTDQMIRFDAPVTPETATVLSQALVQLADMKKQVGGSVKLMISNSPGGSVYHGYHIIDTMANLDVPVDTVIMGGQTASMGALIFISGSKGRRFMSQNASLLVHRPSASGIGGTQNEISDTAQEIERMRHRIDHLISAKSNVSVQDVQNMTDRNTIVYPLKALKLGLTDWVLVGDSNKALNAKSIANLSEKEIEERDTAGRYDDLQTFAFDSMLSNMPKGGKTAATGKGTATLKVVQVSPPNKQSGSNGGQTKDDSERRTSGRFLGFTPLFNPITAPSKSQQKESTAGKEKEATTSGFDIYPYPRAFSVYA